VVVVVFGFGFWGLDFFGFFFFLNLHVFIHCLFLPQLCQQRGGGRVVTSAAEKVVELVYVVFIDG